MWNRRRSKGRFCHRIAYGQTGLGLNYRDEQNAAIQTLLEKVTTEYKNGKRPVSQAAKRILLTGCPLGGIIDKICNAIENHGGVVMCYDTCSGTRSSGLMVDENPDDIVHALAVRYMQVDCSVRTPNKTRLDSLPGLMAEYYRVDGVVEVVLQACHTYNVEAVRVKCIVEAEGIPYLGLETDYWLTLAKLTPVWRHFWKFCKKNSKMRFPAMVYNCWACLSQLCGKNTNLTVWVRLYGL